MTGLLAWVIVALAVLGLSTVRCSLPARAEVSHWQEGDFIIGGLFPMSMSVEDFCDRPLLEQSVPLSELMIFAVRQINNRSDLLPDVRLGFHIRDYCAHESVAASVALSMAGVAPGPAPVPATPAGHPAPGRRGQFVGIVGAGASGTNVATAMVATVHRVPVVSYRGSSIELSDKRRFPFFLRTWPPANLQAEAIVDIVLEHEWSYVGLIYSVNTYGILGGQEIQRLAEKRGICIAYVLPIRQSSSEHEIQDIVDKMLKYNKATVVIFFTFLFTDENYHILAILQRARPTHPGLIFVSSDGFGRVEKLVSSKVENLISGSFAVSNFYKEVPFFADYFREAQTDGRAVSPWFQALIDDCKNNNRCPVTARGSTNRHCVVDAVYAFATALDDILREDCRGSSGCLTNGTVTGSSLLARLKSVQFNGVDGAFQFDENSDPRGKYAVGSFRYVDGVFSKVQVGEWDSRKEVGKRLYIQPGSLEWKRGSVTPPRSVCREECRPGERVVPLEEKCCYGCERCPENAVVSNGTACAECGRFHWPAENFSACRPIPATPVDWQNAVVVVILVLSFAGLLLSVLAAAGLLHYRHHALIKATSRELSCVNIAGLFVTFLSVVLILAHPSRLSCFLSETMIAICLTLTYAPTLLKVNRIYRIFAAGKKSRKKPRFVGPTEQLIIASILTAFQFIIAIVSLVCAPSLPQLYQRSKLDNYAEIYCQFGYGFLASCVYNLLLILACCYYAFKTRKVPSNYNESRFIAASVYSTLVLCLAAVPVYSTASSVLHRVATVCVALQLNAYLTLACVYLPKLYAARFVADVEVADWRSTTGGTELTQSTSAGPAPSASASASMVGRQRLTKVHPAP